MARGTQVLEILEERDPARCDPRLVGSAQDDFQPVFDRAEPQLEARARRPAEAAAPASAAATSDSASGASRPRPARAGPRGSGAPRAAAASRPGTARRAAGAGGLLAGRVRAGSPARGAAGGAGGTDKGGRRLALAPRPTRIDLDDDRARVLHEPVPLSWNR